LQEIVRILRIAKAMPCPPAQFAFMQSPGPGQACHGHFTVQHGTDEGQATFIPS